MSATALLLRQMGVRISGSDEGFYPPVSDYLRHENIPFASGYRKENIPGDADVIVIGKNARLVPDSNEEVRAAMESGKRVCSFADVLHDMTEGTDFSYEEFGDHDEFEEDSELAQLIPETVVFHSNGTCEMLYVSYFEEDDDTPYDNFTDSDITIKGRWRVSGNNVTITEDGGWVWSMNNLDFLKDDEGGYDFQCNLAFEGSTKDIQEIVYDWWPEDGDDGEEEEEDDDDDDDDGGGGNK